MKYVLTYKIHMSCNLYFLRDLFNIYIWDRIHRDRIHCDQIYRDRIYRSPIARHCHVIYMFFMEVVWKLTLLGRTNFFIKLKAIRTIVLSTISYFCYHIRCNKLFLFLCILTIQVSFVKPMQVKLSLRNMIELAT